MAPEAEGSPPRPKRSRFFYIRVSVLLCVLFGVLLYAWGDVRRRGLRTDWERTQPIALVLVPLEPLDEEAVASLKARTRDLEARLTEEMQRYRSGVRPFSLALVVAPPAAARTPPKPPADPGDWVGTVEFNWELSEWVDEVDESAAIDAEVYAARVYLAARSGDGVRTWTVEGTGQQGGRIGVVHIDLDVAMVDVTLFVAAHELFHILGATDKYAPNGSIVVPDGLGDPYQTPLYPQQGAEIMARHRALDASDSVMPETLEELQVGPATAREINWMNDEL